MQSYCEVCRWQILSNLALTLEHRNSIIMVHLLLLLKKNVLFNLLIILFLLFCFLASAGCIHILCFIFSAFFSWFAPNPNLFNKSKWQIHLLSPIHPEKSPLNSFVEIVVLVKAKSKWMSTWISIHPRNTPHPPFSLLPLSSSIFGTHVPHQSKT